MKHAFAQVEATKKANVTTDLRELHTIYRTDHKVTEQDFADSEGYWRFTIIRDPIERIVSTSRHLNLKLSAFALAHWSVQSVQHLAGIHPSVSVPYSVSFGAVNAIKGAASNRDRSSSCYQKGLFRHCRERELS